MNRAFLRALLLAAGSAAFYGAWALFANWSSGRAVRACLAQAAVSFASTMTLTLVAEWLFRRQATPQRGFVLSAGGTAALIVFVTTAVHLMVGTPRLLATIAPSIVCGSMFFTAYAWGLRLSALRASA
jgi:hypothetical protein